MDPAFILPASNLVAPIQKHLYADHFSKRALSADTLQPGRLSSAPPLSNGVPQPPPSLIPQVKPTPMGQ